MPTPEEPSVYWPQAIRDVNRLLKQSIEYALAHRDEALRYALQFGRDLDRSQADRFVGMRRSLSVQIVNLVKYAD